MSDSNLVLRPDLRAGLAVLAAMVVAGAGIVAAILAGDAPTVFAPIVGAVFTAMVVLLIATLLRARIVLTPHEIVVRGPFSRQHRPRSHVAEVVRATIIAPRGASGESLFLLDARRDLLLRVSGGGYKREDIDRLLDVLGAPCSGPARPIGAKEFAEAHPGLLSAAERHPYRFAFTFTFAVAAALAALVLISLAITR
ncbi:hypothetical protein [Actinomadura sp. GTD37]|uniref:hypothetical protein n=1 Tax=Actinomadura sp. GTD37 TaxID=1778030 RepID=UPI0035BF002F